MGLEERELAGAGERASAGGAGRNSIFVPPFFPLLPFLPSTAFLYCLGALFNPQPDLGNDGKTYIPRA